jgi:RimJ/RimL family protein N-acetyltransferase
MTQPEKQGVTQQPTGEIEVAEHPYPRPLSGAEPRRSPSALVPARTALTGRYVTLEPLDAARHARDLFEASHGSEAALRIWDYLPWGPWNSEAEYTKVVRQQTARHDQIYYAVRPAAAEKACGQTSFLDIQPEHGVIEIGSIWFGLTLRRTRSATESIYLMLRYAMDDLGYRRMQWRCNALNSASRTAARRLGFRFEGIFHNHMIFKGRNRDTAWCSILDDEWPDVREIMERWLAPSNFDQDGTAKTSLSALMGGRGPSRRA